MIHLIKQVCDEKGLSLSWFPVTKQFFLLDRKTNKIVLNISADTRPPGSQVDKIDYWDLNDVIEFALQELSPKPDPKKEYTKDVHTEHCCELHKSCKYGREDECTVATGVAPASYPCNCNW